MVEQVAEHWHAKARPTWAAALGACIEQKLLRACNMVLQEVCVRGVRLGLRDRRDESMILFYCWFLGHYVIMLTCVEASI